MKVTQNPRVGRDFSNDSAQGKYTEEKSNLERKAQPSLESTSGDDQAALAYRLDQLNLAGQLKSQAPKIAGITTLVHSRLGIPFPRLRLASTFNKTQSLPHSIEFFPQSHKMVVSSINLIRAVGAYQLEILKRLDQMAVDQIFDEDQYDEISSYQKSLPTELSSKISLFELVHEIFPKGIPDKANEAQLGLLYIEGAALIYLALAKGREVKIQPTTTKEKFDSIHFHLSKGDKHYNTLIFDVRERIAINHMLGALKKDMQEKRSGKSELPQVALIYGRAHSMEKYFTSTSNFKRHRFEAAEKQLHLLYSGQSRGENDKPLGQDEQIKYVRRLIVKHRMATGSNLRHN